MISLNYFLPSTDAKGEHENSLTRAFLSAMRFSPNLLRAFYQLVREGFPAGTDMAALPRAHELDLADLQIETQRGSLGAEASTYASVLITNDPIEIPEKVKRSERSAVYDGVISFGQGVKLFIENKPRKEHVWQEQLDPQKADVPEDATLIERASIVSWRDLVEAIHQLVGFPSLGGGERQVLRDLQEYMNLHYPELNPYKDLGACGNNSELIRMRLASILRNIVRSQELVKYHQGWGNYIETQGHSGIERIGLILESPDTQDWYLELFIGFADTVRQSRHFYAKELDLGALDRFEEQRLKAFGNFHLSFMQRHLIWYDTDPHRLKDYVRYWSAHRDQIGQYNVEAVQDPLNEWIAHDLIINDKAREERLDEVLFNTGRTTVNVSPGFVVKRRWAREEAIRLDKAGKLGNSIRQAIVDGFGILNEKPEFLK